MKKKFNVYLTDTQKENFSKAAELTNRSLSQFMVEASEQYIKRYSVKRFDGIAKRISDLQQELADMYGTVRESDELTGSHPLDDNG